MAPEASCGACSDTTDGVNVQRVFDAVLFSTPHLHLDLSCNEYRSSQPPLPFLADWIGIIFPTDTY